MEYVISLNEKEVGALLLALAGNHELQQKIKEQTWAQTLTASA